MQRGSRNGDPGKWNSEVKGLPGAAMVPLETTTGLPCPVRAKAAGSGHTGDAQGVKGQTHQQWPRTTPKRVST